jgi:hypothetical protein
MCDCEAPRRALEALRVAFVAADVLFNDIRNDWTDPRSECREGFRLCRESLEIIDAALSAQTPDTRRAE